MPLNKRTKLSLKTRKRKSDKTESDLDEEKLIIVDMPDNSGAADLTGAAGVSKCDGVPTCGTTLLRSTTQPPPLFSQPRRLTSQLKLFQRIFKL